MVEWRRGCTIGVQEHIRRIKTTIVIWFILAIGPVYRAQSAIHGAVFAVFPGFTFPVSTDHLAGPAVLGTGPACLDFVTAPITTEFDFLGTFPRKHPSRV